jgi:hypothetical protein
MAATMASSLGCEVGIVFMIFVLFINKIL